MQQDGASVATYTYNDTTGGVTLAHANGVTTVYDVDSLYRITRVHTANSAVAIADYRYGYDATGNRTYMQRMHQPGQPADVYEYDGLDQLIRVWYGANAASPTAITSYNRFQEYILDAVGNRTEVRNDGVRQVYLPNDKHRLTNSMNRYEQIDSILFTYDAKGNLLSDGTNTYTYDYDNRQTGISGPGGPTEYIYDARGWRVGKTVNGVQMYSIYSKRYQTIEERNANNQLLFRYAYGFINDELLTRHEAGGTTNTYHRDALGSISEVTTASGSLIERYAYDVYGMPNIFNSINSALVSSANGNPYLFTGREFDMESGDYYYRARIYKPGIGRFLQMDPAGYVDGMNLYVYVRNDPVSRTDPNGLDAPGCDSVPGCFEGDCTLECCAEHDKCYYDNQCSANYTWPFQLLMFLSKCQACNRAVSACILACKTGLRKASDAPNCFDASTGEFYGWGTGSGC